LIPSKRAGIFRIVKLPRRQLTNKNSRAFAGAAVFEIAGQAFP
jgi:hypothetical protein